MKSMRMENIIHRARPHLFSDGDSGLRAETSAAQTIKNQPASWNAIAADVKSRDSYSVDFSRMNQADSNIFSKIPEVTGFTK